MPTAADIDWSYPDETQPHLSQQDAVLTIPGVTAANAGEYSCIVADLPGVFTAILTVLSIRLLHTRTTIYNLGIYYYY